MLFLRRLWAALTTLARIVAVDGWKAVFQVILQLAGSLRRLSPQQPAPPGQQRQPQQPNCIPISHPAFKVPDPLIYSQYYLMSLGLAVTWDNPDITLKKGGVKVSPSALDPDAEYEIVATIWNNSKDAPVIGLPVSFSYLSFGIGTISHAITDPAKPLRVNLGVKGGPSHPTLASAIWKTPSAPGHYCIQVKLEPEVDANFANNLGQTNTNVVQATSPATFTFIVRNNTAKETTVHFEIDTYYLPEPPPCVEGTNVSQFDPSRHSSALYPIPPGWTVYLDPEMPTLAAGEERGVLTKITPAPDFHGTKGFNINAFDTLSVFLGGVTLYVTVP